MVDLVRFRIPVEVNLESLCIWGRFWIWLIEAASYTLNMGTVPWARVLSWMKRRKWAELQRSWICFLTVESMWPAVFRPWHLWLQTASQPNAFILELLFFFFSLNVFATAVRKLTNIPQEISRSNVTKAEFIFWGVKFTSLTLSCHRPF